MQVYNGRLSSKNVWGKVVLYLREHRQVALHVACGDITDVSIDGNDLIINIEDGMIYNLLVDGKRQIENVVRWQGFELNVKVNIKNIELSSADQDIKKLKDLFGDKLVIKGGKNGI